MQENIITVSDDQISDKKCITVDEMAKTLSIAKMTAYQLTKTKDFPFFYVGKRIIIPLHLFYEWIEKQSKCQSTLLELR